MKGQWLGSYTGSVEGSVMINIDQVEEHYELVAYITPKDNKIPSSIAFIKTETLEFKQSTKAIVRPINPETLAWGNWEYIKKYYTEDFNHASEADVEIERTEDSLVINASTDIGESFNCSLPAPNYKLTSRIQALSKTWDELKAYFSEISRSGYIFRGQNVPYKLCTSFHRASRFRLNEFIAKDVKQLHQRLTAITSHYFDLNVPEQNGAFYNLLQHHGYPTPLLDWTHSPYVAAFFAFRKLPEAYSENDVVRIYMFNNKKWQNRFIQMQHLDLPTPHLSVLEFLAIENPRLVPQQAVTTVTNLFDIEEYVISKEAETGIKFLEAIDIPVADREKAMMDLRFMGITAGSMFPSIDGVCEEMRERNFQ